MKKEKVDEINETYGQYKDEVISLSDKKYKAFKKSLMTSAETINQMVHVSSIIAVMNKWRKKC